MTTANTPGTDMVFGRTSVEERWGWATAVSKSGDLVPKGYRNEDGSPNAAKVFVASEYATMLGQHPLVGLTSISVIEGKPTPSPALMSALIREAGHKLRIKTSGTVEGGDFRAEVTLIRKDDPDYPFTSVWTPQRAARAGLCKYEKGKDGKWHVEARSKYGKPLPWEQFTEDLCKRRAISEVGRDGAEDVLHGAHYTAEELGVPVNADGEIIDAEEVEQDHDGPNVIATMRENPNRNGEAGHNERTEAPHRDAGDAAPSTKGTPPGAQRPGGSRPTSKPAAGPADTTREKTAVAAEWIERINATDELGSVKARTGLYGLRDEADRLHILGHIAADGVSIDDHFLARRNELQQRDAALAEPDVEEIDADFADEELPF